MVIRRVYQNMYNIGILTAPDFVTVQESQESKDYFVNKILDKAEQLAQSFGQVCLHLTTQRKLDIALASGCYHNNISYQVYHPFQISQHFYQTEKKSNHKMMQIYSSGAAVNHFVFNTPYKPGNILKVWESCFTKLDSLYYIGDDIYFNKLQQQYPDWNLERLA